MKVAEEGIEEEGVRQLDFNDIYGDHELLNCSNRICMAALVTAVCHSNTTH